MPDHISRDGLHHLMTNGQRPVLVEALGAGYYADAHLPGAVNIPLLNATLVEDAAAV